MSRLLDFDRAEGTDGLLDDVKRFPRQLDEDKKTIIQRRGTPIIDWNSQMRLSIIVFYT